jgi:signal peptidase II
MAMTQVSKWYGFVFSTLVFSVAVALDLVTKVIVLRELLDGPKLIAVTSFLNITVIHNTGISFGILQETLKEHAELVALVQGAIGVGFLIYALHVYDSSDRIGLALIAGGAVANASDRLINGAVTDFLDFHVSGWHWPMFNVADTLIVCGVLLLLVNVYLALFPQNSGSV